MIQPLASFGNSRDDSKTNLSRSISLSLFDENGNEISVETNETNPIELFIPRDPNVIIPPMIKQNLTQMTTTPHHHLFTLHYVNISSSLSTSVHVEIESEMKNISYLFIYKFDRSPHLNSSINEIDGWTILCSSSEISSLSLLRCLVFV